VSPQAPGTGGVYDRNTSRDPFPFPHPDELPDNGDRERRNLLTPVRAVGTLYRRRLLLITLLPTGEMGARPLARQPWLR
jgi:hypothetical protein